MDVYVVLTAYLHQKGSAESKSLDGDEAVDEDPRKRPQSAEAPWPGLEGGLILKLYEHSLSYALLALFVLSFFLHAAGGARTTVRTRCSTAALPVSTLRYLGTSRFWFESFQNWQSEFLSIGVLVVLSIFLRERGSPQSKPVAAPHSETGES